MAQPRWSKLGIVGLGCAVASAFAVSVASYRNRVLPVERVAPTEARSLPAEESLDGSDGLPADWSERVYKSLAEREYQASHNQNGLQAPNRAHNLRTYFDSEGARVVDRTAAGEPALVELRLRRMGRGEQLAPVAPGPVSNNGARVEIDRGAVTEWFVNSKAGLEQGSTVKERPEGQGPLALELAVQHARAEVHGDTVILTTSTGRRLRYGKLKVTAADQRAVAAHFAIAGTSIIRVIADDAEARYPLTVDPLLTESREPEEDGEWPSYDGVLEGRQNNSEFGFSVAGAGDVNGDGYADVIVGARYFDQGQFGEGAAFVFHGGPAGVGDACVRHRRVRS